MLIQASLLPWGIKGQALDCSFQRVTELPDGLELRNIINQVEETVTMELTYAGQGARLFQHWHDWSHYSGWIAR